MTAETLPTGKNGSTVGKTAHYSPVAASAGGDPTPDTAGFPSEIKPPVWPEPGAPATVRGSAVLRAVADGVIADAVAGSAVSRSAVVAAAADDVRRVERYHAAVRELTIRDAGDGWELGADWRYIHYQHCKQRIKDWWMILRLTLTTPGDGLCWHCERVAKLARAVGIAMTAGHKARKTIAGQQLYLAGLCHDVGKLVCSVSTVYNCGPLSDEDRAAVRLHPVVIADLLRLRGGFERELEHAVRQHHERKGGGGYPDGIADPSPWACILAVCDCYDAMVSRRGYKDAADGKAVLAELAADPGLDQAAVAALAAVLAAGPARKKTA